MAVKFLDPGGDATLLRANKANGGFFTGVGGGTTALTSDFVHGAHLRSYKGSNATAGYIDNVLADTGSRISFYFYINALPASSTDILQVLQTSLGLNVVSVVVTSTGVLQIKKTGTTQIGTDGSILSAGVWYRICLAYTIGSTTVNRFELFVDGVSSISITNATLTSVTSAEAAFGGGGIGDNRYSDIYIDDSASLTDTGNIWVAAKLPIANGTLNQWTTQVGAGTSGYGTGHSSQVNERALSVTNGWSIQNAAKQTEQYTIEAPSVGDFNVGNNIVDYMGWVYAKVGVNSTGNIIVGGVASNISLLTTSAIYTKVAGSSTYPTGGTDIGIDTNTINQLFTLYECGIIVAFIPSHNAGFANYPHSLQVKDGMSRSEGAF